MSRGEVIWLSVLVAILAVYAYVQVSYAMLVDDYISDEVWYVSSARNYLNKIFRVYPMATDRGYRVTLELSTVGRTNYLEVVGKVVEEVVRLGGVVVKSSEYYGSGDNPLYAICVDIPKESLKALATLPQVRDYSIGYCYPNAGGIISYMNLEHPPLGKYLVAASMMICGDIPICWRLPSIASGVGILVLQYLLLRRLIGGFWGSTLATIIPAVTALDRTFRSLTVVAMLDSLLAFFTYLACFYALFGSVSKSSLFLSLSFSTKFSGAFLGPSLYASYTRRIAPARIILLLVYVPLAVFIVLSIPLIVFKGDFLRWWSEAVEGAFRWHLTTKTEPGKGPPTAPPWDWLLGRNSFILRYRYDEAVGFLTDLVASGNPVLYTATAVLSVYVAPRLRDLPDRGYMWLYTWLTWFMYVALWFAGNRTQYSFYMVQLTALLYTLLGILSYYLSDLGNLKRVANTWIEILRTLLRYLRGEVNIKITVYVEKPVPSRQGLKSSLLLISRTIKPRLLLT